MIRYASRHTAKLKLFGTTFYDAGNFNERRRREAPGGSGGMSAQKVLKSESLETQFPALSGRWLCQKSS